MTDHGECVIGRWASFVVADSNHDLTLTDAHVSDCQLGVTEVDACSLQNPRRETGRDVEG